MIHRILWTHFRKICELLRGQTPTYFFDVDQYHAHDSYRVGHIGFYFYKRNPDVPLIFLKKAFRQTKDMHNATLHGW